jgi:tRNA(Phe) wybutosine-synthesizing methylase Tyw3
MHAVSSNTANLPAPKPDPASRIESKSKGVSSCSGRMTVFEAPGKMAIDRPARRRTSRLVFHQRAERGPERQLEHALSADVSANGEDHGAW